jgi:tetratricopeptide (TPR) repeat protein
VQAGLALRPEYAEGYNNLALIDADLGRFDQAAANFEQALRLKPHSADHLSNFGNVRKQQGRLDEAISLFRRALELNPRHALAYNNLGTALKAQGQFAEAQTAYEQSLALSPRYASAMTNLGNVLVKQNRFDEALEWLHRSLEIEPQNPLTINCLGAALSRMRRSDEALECFRRAIEFKPGYVEAYRNRGSQLYELGRFAEATAAFEQALALKPSQADAHFAISSLYLLEEDYARGWAEYEWRLKIDDFESRGLAGPQWDGQPAPDQTILVYDEQGFGDTLQFVRFLPRVKALAARVVFECHGPLKRLFAGLEGAGLEGVDDLFARGDAGPGYNLQVPLMSLGHILHFEADDIPTPGPYLTADPSLLGELGPLLDSPKLKVGLVWQGRPEHPNDHNRSFTLAEMQRLFDVPDVRFYSLQKGAGLDQLTAAGETRITDLGSRLDDFAETAAVLARLDLLISCDSAPVHLAAGLGRPTWIAISKGPDWRWLKDRDDSPWYPSVRLFRQSQPGTWSDVFERVRAALIELVGGGKPATSDIKEEKA